MARTEFDETDTLNLGSSSYAVQTKTDQHHDATNEKTFSKDFYRLQTALVSRPTHVHRERTMSDSLLMIYVSVTLPHH